MWEDGVHRGFDGGAQGCAGCGGVFPGVLAVAVHESQNVREGNGKEHLFFHGVSQPLA